MQRRRDGATSIIGGMKFLSKDKERDNMKLLLQETLLSPEATKFLEENWKDSIKSVGNVVDLR